MVFIADSIISMFVASKDGNSSGLSDATTALSKDVNSALILFVLSLEEEIISASLGPYDLAIIWSSGGRGGVDGSGRVMDG